MAFGRGLDAMAPAVTREAGDEGVGRHGDTVEKDAGAGGGDVDAQLDEGR